MTSPSMGVGGSGPVVTLLVSLALAGCASHPKSAPGAAAAAPATPAAPAGPDAIPASADQPPQARYRAALEAMQRGDAVTAQAQLLELVKARPNDRRANLLLMQVTADPRQMYGTDNFSYTVQAGDTLFSLARKYLRDPLNFYGLARYNGLMPPVELTPGQTIMIPGQPRPPEEERVAPPRAPRARPIPRPAPRHTDEQAGSPPPAKPGVRPAAQQQAQRLRQRGLDQMTAGSIDRAVALLGQAAVLDPDNTAIGADLARARRIQATVHAR